jgi:hypothetical protein
MPPPPARHWILWLAWREILRGDLVRARQALKKIVAGPVVIEPLPEVHGYRWKGQLNGGAVLEGTQNTFRSGGSDRLVTERVLSRTRVRSWESGRASGLPAGEPPAGVASYRE